MSGELSTEREAEAEEIDAHRCSQKQKSKLAGLFCRPETWNFPSLHIYLTTNQYTDRQHLHLQIHLIWFWKMRFLPLWADFVLNS